MKNLFSKGKISILIMVLILGSSMMFLTSSLVAMENSVRSKDPCKDFCEEKYGLNTDEYEACMRGCRHGHGGKD